ncbi:hypothetical protein Syun_012013 [Stephania yunnanensis]|uniref:Uncharacterized protein n=1 Tax=Stephania yunnanensis TaxID=152371 RepID=A0AAP0PEW0_9MAGN
MPSLSLASSQVRDSSELRSAIEEGDVCFLFTDEKNYVFKHFKRGPLTQSLYGTKKN